MIPFNRILLFFLAFTGMGQAVFSQNFSNKGKDFWVAYGYHVRMSGNQQDMVLYFATEEVTNITITIPGLGYTQTLVSPATPTVITSAPIPKTGAQDARLLAESTAPENKGIHITSDKPMVAYAHIYNSNVSGATILFPTNTLGKEYYSINFKQVSNEDDSNGWFYIIATDTGTTTVEITPSANTINHAAGVPFTINLTQGQVFNLMGQLTGTTGGGGGGGGGGGNTIYNGVDLTGSKVRSIASGNGVCKRIAVFSGSGKMFISCDNFNSSSDNYMVQAFPKDAWGKKYLTVPTQSLNNNYFRICVLDPATVVRVNGAPIATALVNNFYFQLPLTSTPMLIEADLPVTVAQYIASQGECGNPPTNTAPGDPEVIYLSPVEQNISRVLWNATPNFNITRHFYNVVIPNTGTAISSFRLDGAAVNPASFTVHPQDPTYSYLSQQLATSGVHSIESDSGFNAIAYGFGSAESYGYNAGTNIRDLYNFLSPINPFSLTNDPVACTGTPVYLSVTFPFQPTSLNWNFYNNPVQSPNTIVFVNNPVSDSTYFIGTKQVWRYRLPLLYTFNLANSSPGYLISITAGTTSSEGCGSTVERDFYLAVYDPPVADMHIFSSGCVTDTLRFRDTTTYLAGTYSYKWYWDFGDGTRDSVRYPRHRYANAGTYIVKFAMISNVGCFSDTARDTIVVTNIPSAAFTTSTPLCQGASVTFTSNAAVVPPGNLNKWYWDFGDGGTQTITAPASSTVTHVYSPWGNYSPHLRVETNSGCSSLRDTNQIYIGPIPTAAFNMPAVVCLPADSARFTDVSVIADGSQAAFTYLWTFGQPASGSADTSLLANPAHYYPSPGPYNVRLTVTSSEGCKDDTLRVFNNVYAQARSGFTVNPENCLNDPTSFSSTATGSGRPVTQWFWDFGDGSPVASGQTVSHTYSTPGVKNILHWVKTDVGCFSDTVTGQVTINDLPDAGFVANGPFCFNRNITFQNNSVANSGIIVNWNWNLGDGTQFNAANGSSFTHAYLTTGVQPVTLVVTTDKGCVSPAFVEDIFINAQPVAGFINPEVCLSDTYAQFTDTSSVVGGAITQWAWNFDNPASGPLNVSTLQNPRHSYSTIGTKDVELIVTSTAGCRDTVIQSFFVNGDIPDAIFNVQQPNRLCANDSVRIKDLSTVNVGSIVKVDIYWDLLGAPGVFETDDFPAPGKVYAHRYPNFQNPLTRSYRIKFLSYSGETCVDSAFADITVNAAPLVRFNPIPDTCLYVNPFLLTQASEIGGVPGTFQFSGVGVSSVGLYNPALTGPRLDTVKYLFTSNAGCRDSASRTIRVLVPPVADFGISATLCETRPMTFTDSSTATAGTINQWIWDFGDGTPVFTAASGSPVNHTYGASANYNASLTVVTGYGCRSQPQNQVVFINPLPVASFRFSDTVCQPQARVDFVNQSSISDGNLQGLRYSWNFGEPLSGPLNSSSSVNPSHTYAGIGPYTVRLTTTSAAGCTDDTMRLVNTIHPRPRAAFSFSSPGICIGDPVTLLDQSDFADGQAAQWFWQFGDGSGSTAPAPVHVYPEVGSVQATLHVSNSFGCRSDTATRTLVVHPYPVVNAGPDLLVLEGNSMSFQATASGADLRYQWTPATYLNSTTVLNPLCTPINETLYTLTVTARGGCASSDEVNVEVLKVPVIPNTFTPNKDGINDVWTITYLRDYPNARVQVFTRTGQLVFESRGYLKPWDGTKAGVPLPTDTYYYIIEPESGRKPVTGYITIVR